MSPQVENWRPGTFLARMDKRVRNELLTLGRTKRYDAREVLLEQGDDGTEVVLLLSGQVRVTARKGDGPEVLLATRVSGDVVGELAAADGRPRSATVTAENDVLGCVILRERFQRFLLDHPGAALLLSRTVGEKLQAANDRRLELGGYSVMVRVARILNEAVETSGSAVVRLTYAELARRAMAAEVTVGQRLRELRDGGVVDTAYGRITIRRPDELRRIAQNS